MKETFLMNKTKLTIFLLSIILLSQNVFGISSDETQPTAADEKTRTFEAIQKIHVLAALIAQNAKNHGVNWLQLGKDGWPRSNPYYRQTKQGLFLLAHSYPTELATPWGEVKVYGGAACDGKKIDYIYNEFRKRLKLKFVRNFCEKGKKPFGISDKVKFYLDNCDNQIPEEELDNYRGTNARILANYCGCDSLYEITEIDGIPLPEPEELIKEYRKYDKIKKEWEELMKKYKERENL